MELPRRVTGRGRALIVAVAAGLAVGGGVGMWLIQADRSPGSVDAAQPADPDARANAIYPVLPDGMEVNNVESEFVPVVPLDGFSIGRRQGTTLTDVATIWMEDPTQVLSTAEVSPQAPSETVRIGNRDVTLSSKNSAGVTPLDDTYEWEEGGVRVSVVGGEVAPIVVEALTVTTGPDGPRLTLADLPDGLERIVPAISPTGPPPRRSGPKLTPQFGSVGTETQITLAVDEGRPLVPGQAYDVVGINGGEGFVTSFGPLTMVDWPLQDQTHWAHMTTFGLDDEAILRLAAGITFTDRATWEAWYPAMVEQLDLASS